MTAACRFVEDPFRFPRQVPMAGTSPVVRVICTKCGQLRTTGGHVDLCGCQPHPATEDVREVESRIPCRLCAVCGLTLTNGGHSRWTSLLCRSCIQRAKAVNSAGGQLVIPIGIHSIMNGVSLKMDGPLNHERLVSFSDQLGATLNAVGGLQAYGRDLLKERCARFGYQAGELVPFADYLEACAIRGVSIDDGWKRMGVDW